MDDAVIVPAGGLAEGDMQCMQQLMGVDPDTSSDNGPSSAYTVSIRNTVEVFHTARIL